MELDVITDGDRDQAVLVAALRGVDPLPVPADELRLAALARWHRLEGLLGGVPASSTTFTPDLVDHFADARAATHARWARLDHRLGELVAAWSAAGIPTTLLKGAALVRAGIVPAAERPMADLDVLVARDRVERAHAIARDHGLESADVATHWQHARTRHHHLPGLVDPVDGTLVELHHRLLDVDHPHHDLDEACRRRLLSLDGGRAGVDVTRLDDVALWLHLAVHFWDDRRRGTGGVLLQVRDLDLVLRRLGPHGLVDLGDLATRVGSAPLMGAVAAVVDELVPTSPSRELRVRLGGPSPSDPHLQRFIWHRVLGRRTALAQLLHPTADVAHTPWRLLTRARRQLWPPMREIRRALGPDAGRRDHLTSLGPVVGEAVANPQGLRAEFALDRWAHNGTRVPVG